MNEAKAKSYNHSRYQLYTLSLVQGVILVLFYGNLAQKQVNKINTHISMCPL